MHEHKFNSYPKAFTYKLISHWQFNNRFQQNIIRNKIFQPSAFTIAAISEGKGSRRIGENDGLEERTEIAGEKPASVTL
jgi:hypothetical protein